MAGFKLRTDLPMNRTYVAARRAGYKLKFSLRDKGEHAFEATKGSYWLSKLFGSAFKTYCEFQIGVEQTAGKTDVYLVRNRGGKKARGIHDERIRTKAKEYINAIITEILAGGGKILEEKEY